MTLDARRERAVDTLGGRVRAEITRERRMMTDELSAEALDRRVAAHVFHPVAYCRPELVRALGDGDASLLVDLSAA